MAFHRFPNGPIRSPLSKEIQLLPMCGKKKFEFGMDALGYAEIVMVV